MPFKHEKSIKTGHTNFVTKIAFNPWDQGATFLAVSSDKTLTAYNSENFEQVMQKEGLHKMGVTDMCFTTNQEELVTCSSDRNVKRWKLNIAEKQLDEVIAYEHSEKDQTELKDNVDKQFLGLAFDGAKNDLYSVSFNSDINQWKADAGGQQSTLTIRGHQNTVTKVVTLQNGSVVSTDQDGRVLAWNLETGLATRPDSLFKHKIQVECLAANSKYVYTSGGD